MLPSMMFLMNKTRFGIIIGWGQRDIGQGFIGGTFGGLSMGSVT